MYREERTEYLEPTEVLVGSVSTVTSSDLQIEVAATLTELDSHAAGWHALSARSRDRIARHSHPFVRAYFHHSVTPPDRWLCMFAYEGERLVGVAPVRIPGNPKQMRHPENNLRLKVLNLLAAEGYETVTASAFLAELRRRFSKLFSISLDCLHERAAAFYVDREALGPLAIFQEEISRGSHLRTTGSFANYSAALSGNFRRNLRRSRSRLQQLPDVRFEFLAGGTIADNDCEEFLTLESSGWKGQLGTAVQSDPAKTRLYREFMHNFRELGWLELYFLRIGERRVAGLMTMRIGSTLNLWKIGYDETFAHCSPGHLLLERAIERAYALEDVTDINCLTDASWLEPWRVQKHYYYNVFIYPLRPLSMVMGVAPMVARRTVSRLPGATWILSTLRSWRTPRK